MIFNFINGFNHIKPCRNNRQTESYHAAHNNQDHGVRGGLLMQTIQIPAVFQRRGLERFMRIGVRPAPVHGGPPDWPPSRTGRASFLHQHSDRFLARLPPLRIACNETAASLRFTT